MRPGLARAGQGGISPVRVIWADFAYGMSASHRAFSTAWIRFCTSSFSNRRATWVLTVLGEMPRPRASSLFDWPEASSSSISHSRAVRPSERIAASLRSKYRRRGARQPRPAHRPRAVKQAAIRAM